MDTRSYGNPALELHKEATKLIKVLVVEDSLVVREFLVYLLGRDPDIRVVGTASNGEEALDAVKRYRPDVVTMDIHMPKMDGIEATRRIMETEPVPIVIVSGSTDPHENTKRSVRWKRGLWRCCAGLPVSATRIMRATQKNCCKR